MFFLVADWKQEDDLSRDPILNSSRFIQENEENVQILLVNYLPFIRYKAREFDFSGKYTRVFDILQNISITDGHPLGIEDLIEENFEYVYHYSGVFLYRDGQRQGEINFNQYGYVSEYKQYFEHETRVSIFDDRGFIGRIDYYDHFDELQYSDYYNELGLMTLQVFYGENPRVFVTADGNQKLKRQLYETLDDVILEILNASIGSENEQENYILGAYNPRMRVLINQIDTGNKTFLMLDGKIEWSNLTETEQRLLLVGRSTIISDAVEIIQMLQKTVEEKKIEMRGKLENLPIYHTNFALGNSNQVKKWTIYLRLGDLNGEKMAICEKLFDEYLLSGNYGAIFETNNFQDQQRILELRKVKIDAHFEVDSDSEDYQNVAHYLVAKAEKRLFTHEADAVKHLQKDEIWQAFVGAVDAYDNTMVLVNPSLSNLTEKMTYARIYADLERQNDFQVQTANCKFRLATQHFIH